MGVTSWYGWGYPAARQDPWYSAVCSLWDHVDETMLQVHSVAAAFSAETVVVSAGGDSLNTYLPVDGTWNPVSYALGSFTVPASGAHVRLQCMGEIYNGYSVVNANSAYSRVYLRAVIDGGVVTPSSTWGTELPHGHFSYERRTQFAHVQVVSLGAGVHSVAVEGLGVVVRNGGTGVNNSYWVPTMLRLVASIVYRKRPYHEQVMVDSPMAYWRFGESSGFPLAGDSARLFHGIVTGTCTRVPAPGLLASDGADGCLYVNGNDATADYTEHGQASSLQMTGLQAFTVTGIIRPESVNASVRGYIIGTGSGASATTGRGWNLSTINGGLTFLRLDGAGGFEGGNIGPSSIIAANSNHWFGLTFTGSIATAWLNGSKVGSLTGLAFSLATTSNFAIGARVGFIAATGFRGGIDDVAVCSGVVADDRMRAQYSASVIDG